MKGWRLAAGPRKALLTLHIVAAVGLIGVTSSVIILAVRAATAGQAEAHALYESTMVLALLLAIPFSMAALVTGLGLGFGTSWGVLRYYWVVAKLALLIAIIVTGATAVGPWAEQLADNTAAGLEGEALGAARWQIGMAGAANLLFMIVAVGLAVFKPWGRIRNRGKTESSAEAGSSETREPALHGQASR